MNNHVPLTSDEREEYDDLLCSIVGTDNKPKATAELADRFHDALLDAEQAGRSWAGRSLEVATRNGLQGILKRWLRNHSEVGYKTKNGRVISLSRRAGVKRGDAFQQVLFEDLTPAEAHTYLRSIETSLSSLGALRTSVQRLVAFVDAHPEAKTVGEALRAEGVTLDELLAA